jgi:hypothetical protein
MAGETTASERPDRVALYARSASKGPDISASFTLS